MIRPTVGRVLWYHPSENDPAPIFRGEVLAAIVTRVVTEKRVNLTVFRADGVTYGRDAVRLCQEDEERPRAPFCEWMPYQKAVAKGEITPTLHAR
jgi:hypothetical protein